MTHKPWKAIILLHHLPSIITHHESLEEAMDWVDQYYPIYGVKVDAIKIFHLAS